MLKVRKIRITRRVGFIIAFNAMVVVGFGIPYLSVGSTAAAVSATNVSTAASADTFANTSVMYVYHQISLHDAYPYYITASFVVAGGLTLYSLTYIPSRSERRSRYASRFATVVRTMY